MPPEVKKFFKNYVYFACYVGLLDSKKSTGMT
uniref:Uncharacterized protein n=1 Tax=Anguilla anguilla TaxID=7936 RepID=A0A0E9X9M2_ANGAN